MTLFNSRNSIHRSPLGAVADGTRVHFKITLPRNMQCSASYLLVQHPDNRIECLDMFWCGMNKGLCTRLMAMPVPPARLGAVWSLPDPAPPIP